MPRSTLTPTALLVSMTLLACSASAPAAVPPQIREFVAAHCADCHTDGAAEGGFDYDRLTATPDDEVAFEQWVRLLERVAAGEMPPADAAPVPPAAAHSFQTQLRDWLRTVAQVRVAKQGRVPTRKLTAVQLERTLHDLLGIDVPLANRLPTEPRRGGFNTVTAGQSFSHFDLENHLAVVDAALDEAFRRATTAPDDWTRSLTAAELSRQNPKQRCRDPELYRDLAVVWSSGLVFYGRVSATTAPEDGWYRFTFDVSSLNTPAQGVWGTVRTGRCVSSAPLMTTIDTFLATETPKTVTVEAWLLKGEMFEVKPADDRLKKGKTPGGQVGAGEMQPQNVPGIGLHHATLSRVHRGPDDEAVRRLLLDDVPVQFDRKGRNSQLASADPAADLERLMLRFAERAFRRPVPREAVQPYIELALSGLHAGETLTQSLRNGYRALLCSPRFLYLHEEPGELDGYALAARLSYFLWGTMPDAELLQLAANDRLREPAVLHDQVERMLADSRGRQFVPDFAGQWLDLSEIDFTEPDRRLYGGFDLVVQQSMLAETQTYLQTMLDENRSVSEVVDADFTFLNERLAAHYGIDGVAGEELRSVPLAADDPRGGLMTQGALLKVTANGTTTSPVIRGVWMSERLLGVHVPPPPQSVPAVEPDIRGATTIREQLAKHRSDASCASCHTKVDPPGFALENFDPVGVWRTNYVRREGNKTRPGPAIDASAELANGEPFADIVGFQTLMATRQPQLAANLAAQLIAYGTGVPSGFGDNADIGEIVQRTAASGYGLRSLLHAVIQSETFRRK